jgi:hypothetical protein
VLGAVGAGVVWISFMPTVLALYPVACAASGRRPVAVLAGCLLGAAAAILFFYRDVLPTLPPAPYRSELPPSWPVEIGLTWTAMSAAWTVGRVVRWRREITAG